MTDTIRTPIGEMWVDDGVLWHRLDEEANITEEHITSVFDAIRTLSGGEPLPAIVDIRNIRFATMAARREFGSPESDALEKATALVVRNTGSRLMAMAYIKLSRPQRPTEVFTDTGPALEWAKQHRMA